MKGLKWKPLLASFALFLATLSVVFSPITANAISDYDNVVKRVNKLEVHARDISPACSETIFNISDPATSWSEGLIEPTTYNSNTTGYLGSDSEGIPFSWNSGVVNGGVSTRDFWSQKEFWSTTTTTDWGSGYSYTYVTFTNDPNATIEFRTVGGVKEMYYKTNPGYWVKTVGYGIYYWPTNWAWNATGTSGCGIVLSDAYDSATIVTEASTSYVYFAYGNFVPPPGYAGVIPPETAPGLGEKLRPNITIDVRDKEVSINSNVNDTVKAQYPDYKVFWFISNTTFDGEGSSCEPAFTTSGYSIPSEPLNFTAPCYGAYSVNAYFAYNNGIYPLADFGDYQIVETTINVNINGGFFSIDTDRGEFECDDNNFCQDTQYDWEDKTCDLLNLGGCVENIFHYIGEMLGINPSLMNPTGSPFVSFQTDNHGLVSVIAAPIGALHTLTVSTCSPIVLPLPFVNRNITLPCYYSLYQSHFGVAFTLYQTIAFGLVSYYVIVGLLHTMKDFKDPKKDQIEVLKL